MTREALLEQVLALPVQQQLELLDKVEESLMRRDDMPFNEDHRAILEERLAELERSPDAGLPWDEVKDYVLARLKKS